MLELQGLNVWRGASQVLSDVSLSVGKGEIVALIGANGAGKTSTLMTISGLLRPRSGEVRFDGQAIQRLSSEAIVTRGLAHCPEGRQIFSSLSIAENLAMGAFLRRDPAGVRDDLERVHTLFPILKERAHLRAGNLSGGEQMMLAISRALMSCPRLLMLDEPSLGLAPQMIERIFDVIEAIRTEGVTVLLVEQNAMMALEIADRAYVIEHGELVLQGTGQALIDDPKVRAAYLGMDDGGAL
ncbi:ABC transporter ATP-binding protein [Aureimonas fodinaquatilis]|uniref:ABC transporter ATP-binding protein n=1 Tax=Aureimonas fodinaquatilis TaxID=2565783 RepID=A0A5B0DS27_9HYPH|nr:ABC transporter ATP-binding protein [Aureimonas fodinaquatilis]KAA0969607.1 ABC transporter ATP-binding protein [Aureimonas fodinaquatilis]